MGWEMLQGGHVVGGVLGVVHAVPLLAGGLLVGFPETPPASQLLPGPELQYYIQQFKKSGFR